MRSALSTAKNEDVLVGRRIGHRSVLLEETLELLSPRAGHLVIDATLGAGGHAEALLETIGPDGRLVGMDRDAVAIEQATRRLERFGSRFTAIRGDHRDLVELLAGIGVTEADRILFDLGVSSMQLDDASRGFSFREDGPLDMRMDRRSGETAAELLARIDEEELRGILWRYGEEKRSRSIARAIVRERETRPVERTGQLVEIVARAAGPAARRYRIHPATRTFQALRIAVNGEVEGLETLVTQAVDLLRPGGRLGVISFHSLEDRAVKHTLRELARPCICPPRLPVCGCGRVEKVRLLTTRPIRARQDELEENPRARSARLRGAERR